MRMPGCTYTRVQAYAEKYLSAHIVTKPYDDLPGNLFVFETCSRALSPVADQRPCGGVWGGTNSSTVDRFLRTQAGVAHYSQSNRILNELCTQLSTSCTDRYKTWRPTVCNNTTCTAKLFHRSSAEYSMVIENQIEMLSLPIEVQT